MNRTVTPITDRIRKAIVAEVERHAMDIEATDAEISEIHVTVKMKNKNIRRVIYTQTSEREVP